MIWNGDPCRWCWLLDVGVCQMLYRKRSWAVRAEWDVCVGDHLPNGHCAISGNSMGMFCSLLACHHTQPYSRTPAHITWHRYVWMEYPNPFWTVNDVFLLCVLVDALLFPFVICYYSNCVIFEMTTTTKKGFGHLFFAVTKRCCVYCVHRIDKNSFKFFMCVFGSVGRSLALVQFIQWVSTVTQTLRTNCISPVIIYLFCRCAVLWSAEPFRAFMSFSHIFSLPNQTPDSGFSGARSFYIFAFFCFFDVIVRQFFALSFICSTNATGGKSNKIPRSSDPGRRPGDNIEHPLTFITCSIFVVRAFYLFTIMMTHERMRAMALAMCTFFFINCDVTA